MNIDRLESIDCGVSEPTTEELAEFIAAYNELNRLKQGLTLHPSVMTQQNVAMLAFKYDEVKCDLAAKLKLIDAIWLIVRKHGYEYGLLNEAVGQMVHDIIEQREELKKENADLKRDKERLARVLAVISGTEMAGEPPRMENGKAVIPEGFYAQGHKNCVQLAHAALQGKDYNDA